MLKVYTRELTASCRDQRVTASDSDCSLYSALARLPNIRYLSPAIRS